MTARTACCMCGGDPGTLTDDAFEMKGFPICAAPAIGPFEADVRADLNFCSCRRCGTVQLRNLVDPRVLYGSAHNSTTHSATWRAHHAAFADFCLRAGLAFHTHLVEVGGASGVLARLLADGFDHYNIIDLAEQDESLRHMTRVSFTRGNCEVCDLPCGGAVIMSHVFEHLYNPRAFVANCAKMGVSDIILSIPDMEDACKKGIVPIHAEHTFYVDERSAAGVFGSGGYSVAARENFRQHSLFMHFTRQGDVRHDAFDSPDKRAALVIGTLESRRARASNLNIPDGAFIAPAGLFGQAIAYYASGSEGIAGFLDNDPCKQGNRVYGHPHTVYPLDRIAKAGPVTVYVSAGPYTEEIAAQLREVNNLVNVVQV